MRRPLSLSQKYAATALPLFLFFANALPAQITPEQRLAHAYALEREGKPEQTIVELNALLDTKSLDTHGIGKAWNVLGLAYEDQGHYVESQHAYQISIRTFESLPDHTKDYAMVLDDLGGLYLEAGQPKLAFKLRKKAFGLYETSKDHAGMSRTSNNLAGVALTLNNRDEGRKYLERAGREAQMTSDLDGDDLAALASMQAWLAQLNGDLTTSVSRYKQSLALLIKRHGEEHPFTGWGYMLLGRAHAAMGESMTALTEMNQGRAILHRTLNNENPRYLTAEIAYSHVLDLTGAHQEAAQIRADATRRLKEEDSRQCGGCTVSATAFR